MKVRNSPAADARSLERVVRYCGDTEAMSAPANESRHEATGTTEHQSLRYEVRRHRRNEPVPHLWTKEGTADRKYEK